MSPTKRRRACEPLSVTRRQLLGLLVIGAATSLVAACETAFNPGAQTAPRATRTAAPASVFPTATPGLVAKASGVLIATGSAWLLSQNNGTIKGFADNVSVADGESFSLFVTVSYEPGATLPAGSFDIQVYRLGWYPDSGARLVYAQRGLPAIVQPSAAVDSDTGLISVAHWSPSTSITVSGWRTGLYVVKLIASDGDQNYIPLVVRDDLNRHDFLFQHTSTTDQAYNNWGGKSLYDSNSSGFRTVGGGTAAVKVSFDRPFAGNGAGDSLRWELNMVRWLEASGFDVAFVSDIDVHRSPDFDARARAVLQAGHSEYWSREMRDHLEAARARGKGLGFFTGDTGAWAIRFEDSSLGPDRVQVCYRQADRDPLAATEPSRATVLWSDAPLNRPTHQLMGIGTNGPLKRSADWVVDDVTAAGANVLFADTGFRRGDVVPGLVGYEYDGMWTTGGPAEVAAGLQVLGRARVVSLRRVDSMLGFVTRHTFDPGPRAASARLSAQVETLEPGITWSLGVDFTATNGKWSLQFGPGGGSPARGQTGAVLSAFVPVGERFLDLGWNDLERNLAADFDEVFGVLPADLAIDALTLRGSVSVKGLKLIDADGEQPLLPETNDPDRLRTMWPVDRGQGTVSMRWTDTGQAELMLRTAAPGGRTESEAHTVAFRPDAGGLVIAVGTMQWSWALDGYKQNLNAIHDVEVDPRIQILTRNMLRALRG
ncbi:MAG: hypothetical protein LC797_04115 [Chloroflexi bacterium]|nr:hypothetical protein [Chloroflexota bacterium]